MLMTELYEGKLKQAIEEAISKGFHFEYPSYILRMTSGEASQQAVKEGYMLSLIKSRKYLYFMMSKKFSEAIGYSLEDLGKAVDSKVEPIKFLATKVAVASPGVV